MTAGDSVSRLRVRHHHACSGQACGQSRIEWTQLDQEIPCHQHCRHGEQDVTRKPHPLPDQRGVIESHAAGIGEPVLEHRIELRPADREKVQQDPQQKAAVVEPERPQPWPFAEQHSVARHIAQAEVDQADREQPERSEQCRVGMVQRQERPVFIVVDQRRVQRAAAKYTGADEVPECRANEVGVGDRIIERPLRADQPVLLDRLDD